MSADTFLPPCMPLPAAMLRLPISSTAKVMYARLLNTTLTAGIEDSNGILFVRFPIMELAAALSRSPVTVKRSLKELEDIGLILRVRRGVGEPNRIYTLLPKGGLTGEMRSWKSGNRRLPRSLIHISEDKRPERNKKADLSGKKKKRIREQGKIAESKSVHTREEKHK